MPSLEEVSVIMPCFNAARYLDLAVESVLAQTYRALRLITVDDGSTDGTRAILESWARRDPRILVLSQPENRGIAAAVNLAFSRATTRWAVMMDADDQMLPHGIETQMRLARGAPGVSVVSGRAVYINNRGDQLGLTALSHIVTEGGRSRSEDDDVIGLLNPSTAVLTSAVLGVGGHRGQFGPAHDLDLWTRLGDAGHRFLTHPEVLLRYRVHGESAVARTGRGAFLLMEFVRACARARRAGIQEPDLEQFKRWWASRPLLERLLTGRRHLVLHGYRSAGLLWGNGQWVRALGVLAGAAILDPAYVLGRLARQWPTGRSHASADQAGKAE